MRERQAACRLFCPPAPTIAVHDQNFATPFGTRDNVFWSGIHSYDATSPTRPSGRQPLDVTTNAATASTDTGFEQRRLHRAFAAASILYIPTGGSIANLVITTGSSSSRFGELRESARTCWKFRASCAAAQLLLRLRSCRRFAWWRGASLGGRPVAQSCAEQVVFSVNPQNSRTSWRIGKRCYTRYDSRMALQRFRLSVCRWAAFISRQPLSRPSQPHPWQRRSEPSSRYRPRRSCRRLSPRLGRIPQSSWRRVLTRSRAPSRFAAP